MNQFSHMNFLLVGLLLVCGCETSVPVSSQAGDEHHLEHHVPDHKPKSIQGAWADLQVRVESISPSSPATEFYKLRDILGWLPELAGDSDLKRDAWERIEDFSSVSLLTTESMENLLARREELLLQLHELAPLLDEAGRPPSFSQREVTTPGEPAMFGIEKDNDQ